MFKVLLQHIPRCLFEPVAALGVIGFIFFLCRHWKKSKSETLLFGFTAVFMVSWRMAMPINADRYALLLAPGAIYFSVVAICGIADFCRKYCRFPAARWFLWILLILSIVKSTDGNPEDRNFFPLMETIKKDARNVPDRPIRVLSNRDVSCFLGDDFQVEVVQIAGPFCYGNLPYADYYLLKLNAKKTPVDCGNPDFQVVQTLRAHKSTFVLMKRVPRQ